MSKRDNPNTKAPAERPAGASAPKADADRGQQKWIDRTLAAHDAAEAFYENRPPKRKI